MMQPLADLYFLTILEHLKDEGASDMRLEAALLRIKEVQDVRCVTCFISPIYTEGICSLYVYLQHLQEDVEIQIGEKLLCLIELQAVVQIALEKIAETLTSTETRQSVSKPMYITSQL